MKDFIFISGNQEKANYLAKWIGHPITHRKVELSELQSLDLRTVVEHKARGAFDVVGQPVLVEDVGLTFNQLGRLPGTFIRWFLEELGTQGLCDLARSFEDRTAYCSIMYALHDGKQMVTFDARQDGSIATEPRSLEGNDWKSSLSWNSVFIPNGTTKTYAEMTDNEVRPFSHRAQAVEKLKAYLTK